MRMAAWQNWLVGDWDVLWQIPASVVALLLLVIVVVRVVGLRSFSKMSGFDLAVTVSIGSVLGATVSSTTPLVAGVGAIVCLLGAQWTVSFFRSRRDAVESSIDNTPLLLMDGPEMLDDNLRSARVMRSDAT